jgi:hypothetical protein
MTIDKFFLFEVVLTVVENVFRMDYHYSFFSPEPYSYPNPPPADANDLPGNPLQPPAGQKRAFWRVKPDHALTWFHPYLVACRIKSR